MGLMREHELHKRRRGRNVGVGAVLGTVILILFGLTIVKIGTGDFAAGPQTTQPSDMEAANGS